MNLNKYTIFFLIVFLFSGCSTIQDNLSLKKNSGVDQFLVEKKDPLVLPPDFEELPVPTTLTTQDTEVEKNDENLDIKSLFKEKSKGNLEKRRRTRLGSSLFWLKTHPPPACLLLLS